MADDEAANDTPITTDALVEHQTIGCIAKPLMLLAGACLLAAFAWGLAALVGKSPGELDTVDWILGAIGLLALMLPIGAIWFVVQKRSQKKTRP